MARVTRNIGLSLGADICWPACSEHIVDKLALLREHGIEVRYEEVRDGHNWENWRDRLQSALTWLFPGPLWMVYE